MKRLYAWLLRRAVARAARQFERVLPIVMGGVQLDLTSKRVYYQGYVWLVYEFDATGCTCYLHPDSAPEAGMVLGLLLGKLMPTQAEVRVSIKHDAFDKTPKVTTDDNIWFSIGVPDDDQVH